MTLAIGSKVRAAGSKSIGVVSSWTIEDGDVRPLGAKRKLRPGEHALTTEQLAERKARARDEAARRRSQR